MRTEILRSEIGTAGAESCGSARVPAGKAYPAQASAVCLIDFCDFLRCGYAGWNLEPGKNRGLYMHHSAHV